MLASEVLVVIHRPRSKMSPKSGRIVFLMLFAKAVLSQEASRADLEKDILKDIYMKSKFHSYVRPHLNETTFDKPVIVDVNMYILRLSIDTKNQDFEVSLYLRQEWNDSRLAYDNQDKLKYILLHDVIGFWTPDLFFSNEKKANFHSITRPNAFARIYPNGRILYSQRLTIQGTCPMNLRRYPFDHQNCKLQVESYGYTTEDILLQWKVSDRSPVEGDTEAVGYDVSLYHDSDIVRVGDNSYGTIRVEIHFTRLLVDYFLHVYVPLVLFIGLSWISFWLNPKSSEIRFIIVLTSTTATLLFPKLNDHLFVAPGYPTMLDIWVAFSGALVFAALLENIYVIYMSHQDGDQSTDTTVQNKVRKDYSETEKNALTSLVLNVMAAKKSVDSASRIFFPFVFIIFHLITIICLIQNQEDS